MYLNIGRTSGRNQPVLDEPGARQEQTFCQFRLYCPKAERIELVLFESYHQSKGENYLMEKLDDGYWHLKLPGRHAGKYYAYRVKHPKGVPGLMQPPSLLADPWARQVMATNHYLQQARSRISEEDTFDWQGDSFVIPEDQRDLVIYEAHLKDLTIHPSAGASSPGTYTGMIEKDITGGIEHLKRLGVNAVEFLPLQKFAGFEPPFEKATPEGFFNTWNPYCRNYWGYMTSYFFAPETMYSSSGSHKAGAVSGNAELAARELKLMVRELHKAGISVIMDVVYNHVSNYDLNPLKYLDKSEFFRLEENGDFKSESGCGNDLRTESPHIRKLIVSSITYWMQEYHIDGFRFDLANLIDRETITEIQKEAKKINPNVLLIAEPWGGGYDPTGFSVHGWSSWNDQIRNGVKGYDPVYSPGFIFGRWHHESTRESLENYIRGTLLHENNGRFHHQEHAVNYLECHDGYTLGDFIRIALDHAKRDSIFPDKSQLIPLSDKEMKCSRLAALFLLVSQGIPMLHAGQEWGRSKWIAPNNEQDPDILKLDHNSYEKDNETNYLDFSEIDANRDLFEFYRDLILFRRKSPLMRYAGPDDIAFHPFEDALHLTFEITGSHPSGQHLLISLNGNPDVSHTVTLPDGSWEMICDGKRVFPDGGYMLKDTEVKVPATTGIIIRKYQ